MTDTVDEKPEIIEEFKETIEAPVDVAQEDKISDEQAKSLKETMKWKSKARDNEAQVHTLSSELEVIRSVMGEMSVEDMKALIEAQKESQLKELERKGEYDRIVEQMRSENQKSLADKESSIASLNKQLTEFNDRINAMTIGRSFSESRYIAENSAIPRSFATKEFESHFDFINGEVIGYDKPRGAADRTPLVDSNGNNKTFESAIEYLFVNHPESKSLIRSKKKPGASSSTIEESATETASKPGRGAKRIESALNALNAKR